MRGRVDRGVESGRTAVEVRHCKSDPTQLADWPALATDARPALTAVARVPDRAALAFDRREVAQPRQVARGPGRGIDAGRIGRIGGEIDDAGPLIDVQALRPVLAAIGAAVDATVRIRAKHMAERADQDRVGILRVDQDGTDVARFAQADVAPVLPAIDRFVDAVAGLDVVARLGVSAAGVKDIGVGCGDCDCADRGVIEAVVHRLPGGTRVAGLPDATTGGTEVERIRLIGDSGSHGCPAAAERADQAPLQAVELRLIGGLGANGRDDEHRQNGDGRANPESLATLAHSAVPRS